MLLSLIGAIVPAVLIAAQGAPHVASDDSLRIAAPGEARMSEAKLDKALAVFRDAVAADLVRGVVLLVARDRRVVVHEAFGWRDQAKKLPMRKDSLFRMASNTKPVTAAAILSLVDRGKLELDDRVSRYLASFDNDKSRAITVRQLLTHTSGLRIRPIFLQPLLTKSDEHPNAPSLLDEVGRFGAIGPAEAPGTSYSYSNAGFNTLAGLVEQLSGQDFRAYVRETLYRPLGMRDSCNHESEADAKRMSAVFRRRDKRGKWHVGWKPGDRPDYPFPRGSGGMITSAWDYASFCQMFLDGGEHAGKRVLSRRLVAEATKSQTSHIDGAPGYGFGWRVRRDGSYEHGGSDGTWAWVDPRRRIVGCVLTQSPGSPDRSARTQRFRKLIEAACE